MFVDAWTAYGGSQFIDSPGTGRYHSYLCEEVVPFVDAHYRTLSDRAHRAISGHSSGSIGAMITPMLRPDLFSALASPGTPSTSRAISPSTVSQCATCATMTATSKRGGPISNLGLRSPSWPMGTC